MEAAPEIDLLVAGAGCGGMVAALTAAALGLRVMVVEASDCVGGTTAYSAGTAWIPGTALAEGSGDTLAAARTYLDGMIGNDDGKALRAAFLAGGAEAVRFLEREADLRLICPTLAPDYVDAPGAVSWGRALVVPPFDGRRLGADFALVRRPREGFTVLGGMMVNRADVDALLNPFSSFGRFRHTVGLLARQAWDRLRYPRGTRLVMGNALVANLLLSLRKHKVALRLQTRLTELRIEDGRVIGVVLNGTEEIAVRAGVVLATGGFSGSGEWRARLLAHPEATRTVAHVGNRGDGLRLGASAGGRLDSAGHRSGAFWMPSSELEAAEGTVLFPHIILDRAKPGIYAIDQDGRRFVNEGDSYHDFVTAMLRRPNGSARPAWLVCDAVALRRYGLGLVHPRALSLRRFLRSGYLRRGTSLSDLAGRIGVDARALEATAARCNDFAATGIDDDFGKGRTDLNRQNGDRTVAPNPCLGPLRTAPFYAVAVWPADLATSAGLATGVDGQVLNEAGAAIPGLYAVGNDMASIMKGTYPGPGTTIGPAIVFGYRAARHAAGLQNT